MKKNHLVPLLDEQPYDSFLHQSSLVYRMSRKRFLSQGGVFRPAMLSSARALGAADLLLNEIQYSPVASELFWSRTDRYQKKDLNHLGAVHGWITGVFHEQNHRILWSFLKDLNLHCPSTVAGAYRYLNFSESLVVVMDMVLADSLDSAVARALYRRRAIYSPGDAFMRKLKQGSVSYRESLLICMHATFLRLEGMHPDDLPGVMQEVFFGSRKAMIRACVKRSLDLEPRFVDLTNPMWQKKHVKTVIQVLGPPRGKKVLELPDRQPHDFDLEFSVGGKWLRSFGL